jgi:prolyl oligopeptidase
MLVGAVTDERPDLWGATVPIAGVQDLLRFQLFGEGKGWEGDLGDPDNADDLKFLYSISPLHNVKPGTKYPPMFVITADHDVRVAPLHTYKYAAALQAAQAGPGRIVVRVETETGHGAGGSTLTQFVDQSSEIIEFFAKTLGLDLTKS